MKKTPWQTNDPGSTLFIVSTPIGNLDDITLRAIAVLRDVDFILAEDTRVSRTLLAHHDIRKPVVSLHGHNEASRVATVLQWLREERRVALICDAGTPAISDPGAHLVRSVAESGYTVSPVPGPSSLTAALAVSGFPATPSHFHGFFPRRPGEQRRLLDRIAGEYGTYLFFESPYRIRRTLQALCETLPEVRACLVREATKRHETIYRGIPADLLAQLVDDEVRGEMVLVIYVPKRSKKPKTFPAHRG